MLFERLAACMLSPARTDFHAQAAEFSLVSLPEKLLAKIVEQDGRCESAARRPAAPSPRQPQFKSKCDLL